MSEWCSNVMLRSGMESPSGTRSGVAACQDAACHVSGRLGGFKVRIMSRIKSGDFGYSSSRVRYVGRLYLDNGDDAGYARTNMLTRFLIRTDGGTLFYVMRGGSYHDGNLVFEYWAGAQFPDEQSELMEFDAYAYDGASATPTLEEISTNIQTDVYKWIGSTVDPNSEGFTRRDSHLFQEVAVDTPVHAIKFGQFSFVNLPAPVVVKAEQQLYVEYETEYSTEMFNPITRKINELDGNYLKWHLDSVTSDGTTITIHSDDNLKFLMNVGELVDLVGTTSKSFAIASLISESAKITINTTDPHDFVLNDQVTISGSSQELYDGTVTISAIPSATSFEVIMSGLGDATGGSVKYHVNNTLYDGEYTIATMPDDHTITIASTLNLRDGVGYASSGGSVTFQIVENTPGGASELTPMAIGDIALDLGGTYRQTYYKMTETNITPQKKSDGRLSEGATQVVDATSTSWGCSIGNGMISMGSLTIKANTFFDFQQLAGWWGNVPAMKIWYEYPQTKLEGYKLTHTLKCKRNFPHMPPEFNNMGEIPTP